MKKLIVSAAVALLGAIAFAKYEMVSVNSSAPVGGMSGKIIALDVASASSGDYGMTFKHIRHAASYTSGWEVVTSVYTNRTQYFNNSNNTWVATNILINVAVTNAVRLLANEFWKTNDLAVVVATNGFATANLAAPEWVMPGDFILCNGAGPNDTATVILEK